MADGGNMFRVPVRKLSRKINCQYNRRKNELLFSSDRLFNKLSSQRPDHFRRSDCEVQNGKMQRHLENCKLLELKNWANDIAVHLTIFLLSIRLSLRNREHDEYDIINNREKVGFERVKPRFSGLGNRRRRSFFKIFLNCNKTPLCSASSLPPRQQGEKESRINLRFSTTATTSFLRRDAVLPLFSCYRGETRSRFVCPNGN